MRMLIFAAIAFFAAGWQFSYADVGQDMRKLFNTVGGYGTVDGPRYLGAQTRHVFSGGGLVFRAPRRAYSLFSARGPELRAGCGGIDLFAGSFSFINKEEFVQMLRTIASNSLGLAFKTALCSTSANLCQAIEDLQKTIESMNRFNIDSCEAAKSLVGGMFGQAENASSSACMSSGRISGLFADQSEARRKCAERGGYESARQQARHGSDEANKLLEFVGGNLTWQAISKVAGGLDKRDKEFLMSMIGTHVVATATNSLRHFPPTVTSAADLSERELVLLTCPDVEECLQVAATSITLQKTFLEMSADLLDDMRARMEGGRVLSERQIEFVTSSPIPVLAIVQADAAGAHGLANVAAEAIGFALAHHFLSTALRQAASATAAWSSRSAAEAGLVAKLLDGTRDLRAALAEESRAAIDRVNTALEISERLGGIRRQLMGDEFGGTRPR